MSERDEWTQDDIRTPEERRTIDIFARVVNEIVAEDKPDKRAWLEAVIRLWDLRFPGTELPFGGKAPGPEDAPRFDVHGLDTQEAVYFYEHEFYPLSNFSPFRVYWEGFDFDTSEHAYHWEKFHGNPELQYRIRTTRSAHDAFKLAEKHKGQERPGWLDIREARMVEIVRAKYSQHEYVRKKLRDTGGRRCVENSHRDPFWGTGPTGGGENRMGRIWDRLYLHYHGPNPSGPHTLASGTV